MEDNRTSNSPKRRRTPLVLLGVGAIAAAGVAGAMLWGHGDSAGGRPAAGSTQSQATTPTVGEITTAGGVDSQSTGNPANPPGAPGSSSDPGTPNAQPPGNPGNPVPTGKPPKFPPVNQLPVLPLPKPTIPPPVVKLP